MVVVVADFTGSIQTEVQQMTHSRLFVTWRQKVEARHWLQRKCLFLIKTTFSASVAKTTHEDVANHIYPETGDWIEVMFRFNAVNTVRVIYSRKAGAPLRTKRSSTSSCWGKVTLRSRTSTSFPSTARQTKIGGIPRLVLPQYPSWHGLLFKHS